jgi:hypothetical protein
MTIAAVDRLVHHATILETDNYSFRFGASSATSKSQKEKSAA